ncbi:MAG: MFS transporter [bacterium]
MQQTSPDRELQLAAWEAAPAKAWATLAQGTFLRRFLLDHGAGNFLLGIIGNLPVIVLLMQPLNSLLLTRSGRPRLLTLVSAILERLLLVVPIVIVLLRADKAVPLWAMVSLIASFLVGSIGLNGWMTWLGDLTDRTERGMFVARRSRYEAVVSIVLGLAAAAILDRFLARGEVQLGYLTIFVAAGCAGLGSVALIRRLFRPQPAHAHDEHSPFERLNLPLKDENFRRFLGFHGWLTFGQTLSGPYWEVYLYKEIKWQTLDVTLYSTLILLVSLACYNYWGRWSDRVGVTPLLRLLMFARLLNPILWLFITPKNVWWILAPEAALTGLFVAGVTPMVLVYALKGGEPEQRSLYLGTFHAVQGVMALIGATLGGIVTSRLEPLHIAWGLGWTLTAYHLVFLATAAIRGTAQLWLIGIDEPEARPIGEIIPLLVADLARRVRTLLAR